MVNRPVPQMPKKGKVNKYDLKDLGLFEGNVKIFNTVEEIKNNPPNIIVAECIRDVAFVQNRFKLQRMRKKTQYCMGLGVYAQLKHDEKRKLKVLRPGKFKFKNVYKPYNGQDLTNKSLLIWRTGGIGDLLFINPILRYLKKKYPTCKILFACGPQYQPMVDNFENVDRVLNLPFPASILFDTNYHAVFEGVIERTREAQKTNAFILFSRSLGLDIPEEDLYPIQTAKSDRVDECKKTLKEWGILDKPFVLLQPRASSPIRTPRYSLWAKIINKIVNLGYKVVITDSPHQKDRINSFIKGLMCQDSVFNYAGISKSLDYSIAMASLSEMCISTDSALIHIGASLGKKVFGLYGPFPAHIRMSTYKNCDYVEPKNCPCSPCFIHGHLPCKYAVGGVSSCYDKIDLNECFEKIENLLKG